MSDHGALYGALLDWCSRKNVSLRIIQTVHVRGEQEWVAIATQVRGCEVRVGWRGDGPTAKAAIDALIATLPKSAIPTATWRAGVHISDEAVAAIADAGTTA